ncbi:MAG: trigger factor [Lachnospiraceae bacterium]|nr:trigger factor [Lachnospiraceae bacterium]
MSTKYELMNDGDAKLTIEVDNKVFLECEDKVYSSQKSRFNIPGFRKGHATKDMIWKLYGREVFYEDAVNECINKTYYDGVKEYKDNIISRPEISVVQVGSDKNFIYEALVAVKPDFKLAQYKGIEVKKEKIEVTDEDIKKRIDIELEKNSRLVSVDRPVKDKDFVVLDFDGYQDGKRFDGGKSEGYTLEIGSRTFIDGFEDQLIGKEKEKPIDVNVTFPTNYGNKDLAGKPALFKCIIHEIKEKQMPEFNDEFVSEVSEYEKVDDYKKYIKGEIEKAKEVSSKANMKNSLIDKVVNDTKIDLTERAIKQGIDDIASNIDHRLRHQGMTFEDYLRAIGKTREDWDKEQRDTAIGNIKRYIVLEEIAKVENIEAGDDLVDEYLENMSMQYGTTKEELKKGLTPSQIKNIKEDMKYPAVGDFLYKNANIK